MCIGHENAIIEIPQQKVEWKCLLNWISRFITGFPKFYCFPIFVSDLMSYTWNFLRK